MSEKPGEDTSKSDGDIDPRLVKLGVGISALIVAPLGLAGFVGARWVSPRLRVNPWWGVIGALALVPISLLVFGVPGVARWPLSFFDSVTSGEYAGALLVTGVWGPLLGALAGFSWRLYAEWGSTPSLLAARRTRKVVRAIADRALRNGYVTVGVSREDGTSRVVLPPSSTNTGTLVLGATGAGKTRGVMSMLSDAIAAGDPVVYVDLKGSQDVPMDLAGLAAKYGRPFWHFKLFDASTQPYVGPAPGGPASYNPAGYGDATRRKDLIIEALGSSNEYYSNITANYLLTSFLVLQAAGLLEGRSAMAAILEVMEPNELLRTSRKIPPGNPMRSRLVELVELEVRKASKDRDFASSLGSLRNYLSLLMNSIAGPFISSNGDVIDFSEVDRSGGVVVFSLSDMEYRKLAAQLGTLVIQDISTYIGVREGDVVLKEKPFYLVVDEFSAFGRDNILGLLARGRSANVHTLLATQNLADLARAGDGFREQALGIVGSFVLFRGNTRADCEVMSGLTGKSEEGESGSTGDFVDWPEIQRLGTGECVVVNNMAAPKDMPKGFRAGRLERAMVVLREIPEVHVTSMRLRVSNDSSGNWLAEAPVDDDVEQFLAEMSPQQMMDPVVSEDIFLGVMAGTESDEAPLVVAVEPDEVPVEFAEGGNPEQERQPEFPIAEVRESPRGEEERFGGIMGDIVATASAAAEPAAKAKTSAPKKKAVKPARTQVVVEALDPEPVAVTVVEVSPTEITGRLGRNRGLQPPEAPPPRRPRSVE